MIAALKITVFCIFLGGPVFGDAEAAKPVEGGQGGADTDMAKIMETIVQLGNLTYRAIYDETDAIAANETKVIMTQVKATVKELSQGIKNNEGNITGLDQSLDLINRKLDQTNILYKSLETKLDTVEVKITMNLSQKIDSLKDRVDTKLDTMDTKLDTMDNRISALINLLLAYIHNKTIPVPPVTNSNFIRGHKNFRN